MCIITERNLVAPKNLEDCIYFIEKKLAVHVMHNYDRDIPNTN